MSELLQIAFTSVSLPGTKELASRIYAAMLPSTSYGPPGSGWHEDKTLAIDCINSAVTFMTVFALYGQGIDLKDIGAGDLVIHTKIVQPKHE